MFKKTVALMLAVMMLLQPVMASAVTWGEVVSALKNSGSYSGEGTSASMNEYGDVTVSGGKVTDVELLNGQLSGTSKYTFSEVEIGGQKFGVYVDGTVTLGQGTRVNTENTTISASNGADVRVEVDAEASINSDKVLVHAGTESSAMLNSEGTITASEVNVISNSEKHALNNMAGFINSGKVNAESVEGYAYEQGTVLIVNHGRIDTDGGTVHGEADDEGYVSINNPGMINGDYTVDANDEGSVEAYNGGSVQGGVSADADDEGYVSVSNSGTISGGYYATVDDSASMYMGNSGQTPMMDAYVYDSGSMTVSNSKGGATENMWITTTDEAKVTVRNEGEIDSLVMDKYDDSMVTYTGEGAVDKAVIYVNTPTADTLSAEAIQEILANIDLPEDTNAVKELWTYDESGEWTAIYKIEADGSVKLVEVLKEEEPADDTPSPEMIRHWMEMQRQEEAIGGVYGSPYWLKQLYLGYHSLNLRLYHDGERVLFREILSWMWDGTPDKRLTLRVNLDDPDKLTMRLDGEVIEILERCEFAVITLEDKNRDVVMEYRVSDLKAAREIYGLARGDLLCVGGPDDPVMKIDEDGFMMPVEQDAKK